MKQMCFELCQELLAGKSEETENLVKLGNNLFRDWYVDRVSDIEFNNAASLLEILFIRDEMDTSNFLTILL